MFPADMMKPNLTLRALSLLLLAAALLAPAVASAQVPDAGSSMMNSAFLKLFGPNTNFSCKAELHLLDAIQKEMEVIPLSLAVWDGKMRIDIDFTEVKGADIPPAMMPALKQIGMDQSIIIQRPDQKIVLSIYPHAKSYSEKIMSKDEIAASEKTYTVVKEKLGRETFEGHSCEKTKVTLTDDKGVKHLATAWYAADLKDFPVQVKITEQDTTLVMKFRDVKLGKPDASRFEAPAGLTKYKSDEALMEAATKDKLPK
jgi:hypothetical protein